MNPHGLSMPVLSATFAGLVGILQPRVNSVYIVRMEGISMADVAVR